MREAGRASMLPVSGRACGVPAGLPGGMEAERPGRSEAVVLPAHLPERERRPVGRSPARRRSGAVWWALTPGG